MQSIALVHPHISFELKFDGKTIFKTTAQNEQLETIKEIFSKEVSSSLKTVLRTDKLSGLKISGFVSSPDFTRSSKKDYYLYVNNRLVKCPAFQKAVDMVYKNLIGNSRYPFVVLNLEIPPSDVDVNVHPTKKEVRYKNPNQIFNFIYTSVDAALKSIKETSMEISTSENKTTSKEVLEDTDTIYVSPNASIADIFTRKEEDSTPNYIFTKPKESTKVIPIKQDIQTKFIKEPEFVKSDIIIGQYAKTYILIEKENGLEIVDQHIADERYIYEKLKKSKNIDCQLLFISDVLEVSATDRALLESNKDKLAKFGYEIDFTSDTELIFRKVPQLLSKVSPKEILADILENMHGDLDNIEEQILITTSCKAAVKANTYLNQYQMEEIIKNWRTTEHPETCPHGRPVAKFFEHKELAKFFQRNK